MHVNLWSTILYQFVGISVNCCPSVSTPMRLCHNRRMWLLSLCTVWLSDEQQLPLETQEDDFPTIGDAVGQDENDPGHEQPQPQPRFSPAAEAEAAHWGMYQLCCDTPFFRGTLLEK